MTSKGMSNRIDPVFSRLYLRSTTRESYCLIQPPPEADILFSVSQKNQPLFILL